jgi:hypothetical protein
MEGHVKHYVSYNNLGPGEIALCMIRTGIIREGEVVKTIEPGTLVTRADAPPERKVNSVDLSLHPVLCLASWVYDQHEHVHGMCKLCGTPECLPRQWSDQILTEANENAYVIVGPQP